MLVSTMYPFMTISSRIKCAFSKLNMIYRPYCATHNHHTQKPTTRLVHYRASRRKAATRYEGTARTSSSHCKPTRYDPIHTKRAQLTTDTHCTQTLPQLAVVYGTYHTFKVLVHRLHERMDELEDTEFVLYPFPPHREYTHQNTASRHTKEPCSDGTTRLSTHSPPSRRL